MLIPKKHLNLDVSVLRVSAIMLQELKKRGVVGFERLREKVIKRVGPDGELVFLPALNLLYLLGVLDYHIKNDILEYRAN